MTRRPIMELLPAAATPAPVWSCLRLLFDQPEALVVGAAIEFAAAVVASDGALERLHAVDGGEAVSANVDVVALHAAAFEGERVEWMFAGDAQFRAGGCPFGTVGIRVSAAAAFVGNEMGEFVFEGAPEFLRRAFPELRVEFDGPVRPPRATSGSLHAWVPENTHLAGKFGQPQTIRSFRAPSREPAVPAGGSGPRGYRNLGNVQPRRPTEL